MKRLKYVSENDIYIDGCEWISQFIARWHGHLIQNGQQINSINKIIKLDEVSEKVEKKTPKMNENGSK